MDDLERAKAVLLGDDTLGVAACRTPAGGPGDGGADRDDAIETLTGSGRGVRPLLQWLAAGARLDGFSAADRVVGKGAALLYAKLGVKAVWAATMSEAGLAALRAHGIEASYGTLVPVILNRDGTGMCPIERSVASIDDLDAAETAIRAAVARLMAR
ncbi:DUF1893 domain-containing protein [Bifidobacterium sp. MA2]|uniref:DUF1893 domain-containing protein n=1 Tax=Bifidobacterium santillanense TaxID=2809028 RepID=A0ABS5UR37_9BIFI|nr:DUF1893 domain-containing protein [Bifidobacterium santillanense]MBT1173218.1 DUF1893 domain-containing protein [Bifidobacterium santillanense]